jgi:glycogen(starch) synthase
MRHLIICPEYPPAPIPPGGIGTYVLHISRLLAEAGETVHVIGQRWDGAPKAVEEACAGRLIIHRVSLEEPVRGARMDIDPVVALKELTGLRHSDFQRQCFSWQASLLAETLVQQDGIDLIEAQEYDAPLYYFQLRRALGLGPKRIPPCLVHLHSPTEFIFRHNHYDSWRQEYATAVRLENYSIAAADARLCPSNYFARLAEAHYGLAEGAINVIPIPIGDFPFLERSPEVWANGTICYVGRLEPRKGVVEWVDAAVSAAREYVSQHFELIGTDLPYTANMSVREFLETQIPNSLKARFHFRGPRSRPELLQFLAQAKVAVVPSRWENFPNACIEAMCSGLPVIATCKGGMAEMIEDARTGWLARECRSADLEGALRRVLDTPPSDMAAMGRAASEAIRRICDNTSILERHIRLRRDIAGRPASCSLSLPANLWWRGRRDRSESTTCLSRAEGKDGVAVIVACRDHGAMLSDCLTSLRHQTQAPVTVVVVVADRQDDETRPAADRARAEGWQVCEAQSHGLAAMKNAGISAVISAGSNPAAFVFLDSLDRLYPDFVEACAAVLHRYPDVGVISSWTQLRDGADGFFAHPCPSFPHQLLFHEAAPTAAIRAKALREAGLFRELMGDGYEDWDLVNAVMANGWAAVTFPALLSERAAERRPSQMLSTFVGHQHMRDQMLARIPDVVAYYAQALVHILERRIFQLQSSSERNDGFKRIDWFARILRPRDMLHLPLAQQFALVRHALRHPGRATRFFLWHVKRALGRSS